MGYFKHEALVVVTNERTKGRVEEFREQMPDEYRHLLVGPVGVVNGYEVWCFLPDGSKEGWTYSDGAHEWRKRLAALCEEILADWSYSEFGGDDEDFTRHVTQHEGPEAIP